MDVDDDDEYVEVTTAELIAAGYAGTTLSGGR